MRYPASIPVLLILTLALAGCANAPELVPSANNPGPNLNPTTSVSSTPSYEASLEYGDCPELLDQFELDTVDVTCAYLSVPEQRADPDRATLQLAVALIPSRSDTPRPDPIVYLEGGPGGSAVLGIADWIDSPLRDEYDLILFDQRGTGLSLPSLNCAEMEQTQDDDEIMLTAEACRDRLNDANINLSAYNSAENAADVADLIAQLDYDEVNLLGISYGTRLALTVLRNNSAGVRSVIIDSPYPPQVKAYDEQALNAGLAIQALLSGCADDEACETAFPDLEARFYALIDQLNAEPVLLELTDGESGELREIEVTGDDLVSSISEWLYVTDLISYVPLAIDQLDTNETEALSFLYEASGSGFRRQSDNESDLSDSEAMFYAVECREESSFSSPSQARTAAAALPPQLADALIGSVDGFFDLCKIWEVDQADASERAPVLSAVPTLVLAGEYDPVTPPSWGELAAEGLSNGYFHVLPGGGHAVIDASDCIMAIATEFLDDPERAPDASCLEALSPVFAYEIP